VSEDRRRLVCNLTQRASGDLDYITGMLGQNRTAAVNRALSTLRFLIDVERMGGKITIELPDGTVERVRFW
jgi:hypothetical protein